VTRCYNIRECCTALLQVLNLARFISVAKTRPLSWRLDHPYLVADRSGVILQGAPLPACLPVPACACLRLPAPACACLCLPAPIFIIVRFVIVGGKRSRHPETSCCLCPPFPGTVVFLLYHDVMMLTIAWQAPALLKLLCWEAGRDSRAEQSEPE
jgi:hypothetical protein